MALYCPSNTRPADPKRASAFIKSIYVCSSWNDVSSTSEAIPPGVMPYWYQVVENLFDNCSAMIREALRPSAAAAVERNKGLQSMPSNAPTSRRFSAIPQRVPAAEEDLSRVQTRRCVRVSIIPGLISCAAWFGQNECRSIGVGQVGWLSVG